MPFRRCRCAARRPSVSRLRTAWRWRRKHTTPLIGRSSLMPWSRPPSPSAGRAIHVYVDETRPVLQGARLTAWELQRLGVPMTLITDSMAGHFMSRGKVDLVIVGADRIAANGDVANKIGTYSLAVLAREHGIPFYVAAPTSTVDLSLSSGIEIPIEERSAREVTDIAGIRIAPNGVNAVHPAFDVTPGRFVTAIVTEHGILRPPYAASLTGATRGS